MQREMPAEVLVAHVLLWCAWLLLAGHVLLSPLPEGGAGEFLAVHKGEAVALAVVLVANVGALLGRPWARALLLAALFAGAALLVVAVSMGATQLRGAGRLLLLSLAISGLASYLLVASPGAAWFTERNE
jgi:hypothetical protein